MLINIFSFKKHVAHKVLPVFLWRREGDLNPRTGVTRLLVFEASPFSLLGTSPQMISQRLATNKGQKPQPETKPKTGRKLLQDTAKVIIA